MTDQSTESHYHKKSLERFLKEYVPAPRAASGRLEIRKCTHENLKWAAKIYSESSSEGIREYAALLEKLGKEMQRRGVFKIGALPLSCFMDVIA